MGKHFYNFPLKLLEFAFTGTAYFACNCNADKLTKTSPQSLALPNFTIPYLSHPCLLPKISCFHFIKWKEKTSGGCTQFIFRSSTSHFISFQTRIMPQSSVTHLGKQQLRRYREYGFYLIYPKYGQNRNFFIELFISCFPKLHSNLEKVSLFWKGETHQLNKHLPV